MIHKIIQKLNWYFRTLLTKLNIKRKYLIGNSYLKLDYNSRLPDFKSSFLDYDRFLPHFVKYLPANSSVVDVGANVGDTLFEMVNANSNLEYICIEADGNFYKDLKINVFEGMVNGSMLLQADELFLTNAIKGIEWVVAYREKRYFNKTTKEILDELNKLVPV